MSVLGTPTPGDRPVAPRRPHSVEGTPKLVFFGSTISPDCQRCGAYCSTNTGHKYCSHVTCPLALREIKRRRRKRTSTLEKVYIPLKRAEKAPPAAP